MSTTLSIADGTIDTDTGSAPTHRFINTRDKNDGTFLYEQIKGFGMCGGVKDRERQEVEAMLRFAPPYSDEDLRALNLENAPNTTLGELPRRISQAESTWTDFTSSSSGLWKVTFPDLPGEISDAVSEQVSELVNNLWSKDPKHCLCMQLAFRQFSTYGIGPMVWIDCYDPSPIARTASSMVFPPDTRLTLDNFTEAALHDSCTAQDLYGIIRGETGKTRAKLHGWNREEVMKVLKANATGNGVIDATWSSLESVELAERQGNNIWGNYAKQSIKIIHVFVQEYEPDNEDKVISYYVLAQNGTNWRIIRSKPHEYAHARECMALANDRVGSDMTISGLRGLGVDMLEHARSTDILHCASLYAAYRSSIPVYGVNGAAAANAADQISVRPNGVVIPQGFTEVQSLVDAQAGGWYIDRLTNNADTFQGIYSINAPNKGGVQRTAKEATYDAAKEADLRSSQVAPMVRTFFEPLGREFMRRLMRFPRDGAGKVMNYKGKDLAAKFWKNIEKISRQTGVSLSLLEDFEVNINPSSTPGGLDKKLMRHTAAMTIYPTLQSQAQRNWITNQGLIAIFGYQAAQPFLNKDEVLPPSDRVTALDSENADLESGYQRRVLPEQDHLAHLGPLAPEGVGHIPYAMQMLKRIQEGIFEQFVTDPVEALAEQLRAAVTMQAHITAHLSMISQNPIVMQMPEVQGYFDFAAQFEQIVVQSIGAFQKMAAERGPQGGGEGAEMLKVQAEIQRKDALAAAEIERTNQKHQVKLGNQVQTMQARHDEKSASAILDQVIKAKSAQTDLAVKASAAVLDIQAEETKIEMQKQAAAEAAKKPSNE